MKKNFILKCMLIVAMLPISSLIAKEMKPIDAFIEHIREANKFVPVSNIWKTNNTYDKTTMSKFVNDAQPLLIDYAHVADLLKEKHTAVELSFPALGGGSWTMELGRYDFLTNDFEVHEKGENNSDKKIDYTPGLYYSGIVKGIPGSLAVFSFFNNEVYGMFSIPGEGNYILVPNTLEGEYWNSNQHYILYNDADLKIANQGPRCASDQLPKLGDPMAYAKTTTTANNNVYNNCINVRVFAVADYLMFQKKGSSVNATNYLTSLFNNKAAIYRNEGIIITLKYTQVNTATDEYNGLPNVSSRWLTKFSWVTQDSKHGADLAMLYTTKNAGMGGVAWLRTLCYNYYASDSAGPYGFCNINNSTATSVSPAFPTYNWDIEVDAHEMGHIVGSPHTHACVWNPPARNTAIDGCYTIEGSCPDPGDPTSAVGGTIMSYCHLTSSTIKFVNGFGPQPGDTVRRFVNSRFSSSCGETYNPSVSFTTPSASPRMIAANRECTDPTGTTFYWKDNNTADQADDTLVLMIKKGTNNIGNLNTAGFSVKAGTVTGYGSGTGETVTFPVGVAGVVTNSRAMRSYWRVVATTQPTTAVEVMFPFTLKDTADVDGSVPGTTLLHDFRFYKVDDTTTYAPGATFTSLAASKFHVYTYNPTASTSKWSFSTMGTGGTTYRAHMQMTNLSGGGTGFYTYITGAVNGVEDVNGDAVINVYPNPTNSQWFVSVDKTNADRLSFSLFSADGRMVHTQALQSGKINTIEAAHLPAGIYYYRIIGGANTSAGSLVKE